MGPRALVAWGVAAVVSPAGAIYGGFDDASGVPEAARVDEPVFTELRVAPESATTITIAHQGTEVRVERGEGAWRAPSEQGYAVDEDVVRRVLTGLADLRYAAPRTALEERFARLEVDTPGANSAATRVTVEAAEDRVLADAIIGKRSQAITGTERGTYLRLPDGERAWLAFGTLDIPTATLDWLETTLPSIARQDLKLIAVTADEGDGFTAGRTTAEEDMTLVDAVPEGRTADADQIRRLAGVFADLRFEDVRPANDVEWSMPVTRIAGTSFAGETLVAEVATIDDERWVHFEDQADWVYRLPTFQTERLDTRLEDLLVEPEAS